MDKALTADAHLTASPAADALSATTYPVIAAISFSHLLNDMMQSVLLAIYPMLKLGLNLSFAQIGLITLAYQLTASLLQPLIGLYTDRRPMPYSLPVGMGSTLLGLLSLSQAGSFGAVLMSAMLIGMGSSVFHPESSRVARMAAGSQPGLGNRCFKLVATSVRPLVRCSPR
jgi:FSR family fosmidomycin resistance protein-like MFS transporter